MMSEVIIMPIGEPVLTGCEGKTLSIILNSMKKTASPFKKAIKGKESGGHLNENGLTQIYVQQVSIQLPSQFGASNQYEDIFLGTKGKPDIYFYKNEEGVTHCPLFVVEAKRLPAPKKSREKEYITGNNENGGIERFKIEKHGKELPACGMLGYVEKEDFLFWKKCINSWIAELALTTNMWREDEILAETERDNDFMVLESIAHRKSQTGVRLYHLWINTR